MSEQSRLRRVVECARRFVSCADEFGPECGQFCGEHLDVLNAALNALTDEGPGTPAVCPDCLCAFVAETGERTTPGEPILPPYQDDTEVTK